MFKKTEKKKERPVAAARAPNVESAISIIGQGMRIEGDVTTDGTVRIEGFVRGTIRAGKAVVLGKSGEINGDVSTQDAVIGGRVVGTVIAESRLELQSTCSIDGDVRAPAEHLLLEEGARFNGTIKMVGPEEPIAALPPQVENHGQH